MHSVVVDKLIISPLNYFWDEVSEVAMIKVRMVDILWSQKGNVVAYYLCLTPSEMKYLQNILFVQDEEERKKLNLKADEDNWSQ